jgi:hypothetical protein
MFWLAWQLVGVIVVVGAIFIVANIIAALWDWLRGHTLMFLIAVVVVIWLAIAMGSAMVITFNTYWHQ